ncbi:MAG: hypothetical protein ACJAS4_003123 [Bacteriovoracaceae bacterium]|jgi:hypothetical protein
MKIILSLIKKFFVQDYIDLEKGLETPLETQKKTLFKILSYTKYSVNDFSKLPIRRYEQFHNIKALTKNPPKFFETTSGSSGSKKRIPYTKELIDDFTTMFKVWCYDVLAFGPKLSGGKIYFSISPQFTKNQHINDDSDYLSGLTGLIFKRFVLIPKKVKMITDPEVYKKVTAMYLISAKNLEIISIWSPSFLIVLLDSIVESHEEIETALLSREYEWNGLKFKFPKTEKFKIHELRKANLDFTNLFPQLKFISSWGALNSNQDFLWLKKTFYKSLVQEKGLLATEGVLSIPSIKYNHFIPALTQTYFEFLDSSKNILPIHKLTVGSKYEVIISQSSGLLRYQLGDMIKVTAMVKNTPCFEFLGRASNVSDLVGEKLNEIFLNDGLQELNSPPCIFIPSLLTKRYYCVSEFNLDKGFIDALLMKNPHYENAIKLGQLHPLEFLTTGNLNQKIKRYFTEEKGMVLGDIKDQILYKNESDNKLLDYLF